MSRNGERQEKTGNDTTTAVQQAVKVFNRFGTG